MLSTVPQSPISSADIEKFIRVDLKQGPTVTVALVQVPSMPIAAEHVNHPDTNHATVRSVVHTINGQKVVLAQCPGAGTGNNKTCYTWLWNV